MLGKNFIGQCKLKDLHYNSLFKIVNKNGVFSNKTFVKRSGDYSFSERKYCCTNFDDICDFKFISGNQIVTTDF